MFLEPFPVIEVEQIAAPIGPSLHRIVHVSNLFGALASPPVSRAYIQHLGVLGPLNGGPRHNVFSTTSSQPHMVSLLHLVGSYESRSGAPS